MNVHPLVKATVVEERIAKKSFLLGALPSYPSVLGSEKGWFSEKCRWKPELTQTLSTPPPSPGVTHVSERLCQAGAPTCSLLLAEFALLHRFRQGRSRASSVSTEAPSQCHYSIQVSCLKAKQPQRQKNITMHPSPHLVGSPVLTKGCPGVHTLCFGSTCGKLHTDPLEKTKKYPLNTEPILLF